MSESKRLFTAIRFPEKTIEQIAKVQEIVKQSDPDARYVKPITNFHITLYFIGMADKEEVAAQALENACKRYEELDGAPLDLVFNRLGTFRNRGGSLIWLGIERNEHLDLLAKLVPEELDKLGIEAQFKKYRPHITLARKYKGDYQDLEFELPEPITANEAALVWSHHNSEDVLVYDDLNIYPFSSK